MFFYCPANTKYNVIEALQQFGGYVKPFSFTKQGVTMWQTM
jgi:D-glycero-alpha-D-manno-heptose-7-phosphate kinase